MDNNIIKEYIKFLEDKIIYNSNYTSYKELMTEFASIYCESFINNKIKGL